ncbi:MAG: DNA alkylation repair protein [Lachnospiraceae bacterium]|nr:DNA alkylation repair protein [Lachnospiraceae bacterium]
MEKLQKALFDNQDKEYRVFQQKLMPGIELENIIGVRLPVIRKIAKENAKTEDAKKFLDLLPHKYYDENQLHGFLINLIKDYDECVKRIDEFLPYVDNWAVCDSINPKMLSKHKEELIKDIKRWVSSKETYTIRHGIHMLMAFFLDSDFKKEYLEIPAKIVSEEYYVNMMIAWFFATALAKKWDATITYIEEKKLPVWVHNKTIQKAIESFRVNEEHKQYLRSLKIK